MPTCQVGKYPFWWAITCKLSETSRVSAGNRIILVPKHKRTNDNPPMMLGMDPEMQKEMTVFVEKTRPVFTNPDEDKLFIKDDGNGFPEGTTGKRLVAFFEKSGVTSTRVGPTHLRKFISTQTYELGDATRARLWRRLCHTVLEQNGIAMNKQTAPEQPQRLCKL